MKVPLVLAGKYNHLHENNGLDNFRPRQDYIEISNKLGGKLYGYNSSDAAWYRLIRRLEKRLKLDVVESLSAAAHLSEHNAIISTSEKMAIPLAVSCYFDRRTIPHIVIAHKLSSGYKKKLLHVWKLHKTFSQLICLCRAQADYAIKEMGISETSVNFIYDKVDHQFFHPMQVDTEDYILAVGQEQRDYQTLLQAIAGTGLKLIVIASSPWSTSRIRIDKEADISVLSHIPFQELRSLYARARLVVVPLFNVDYAAGVNTVLEAMAMAKPVVVSQTRGIVDYVSHDETGIFVPPEDPKELRSTILSLWSQNDALNRLGINARQAVEEHMNLDIYVDRIVKIVEKAIE